MKQQDGQKPSAYERLRPRQRRFVDAFIECWNASEAYRRSGGTGKNANVNGPRMLANAGIRAAVEERLNECGLSCAEVTARVAEMARADIGALWRVTQVMSDGGDEEEADGAPEVVAVVPEPDWGRILGDGRDPRLSRGIKSLRITSRGVSIEMRDTFRPLELAARIHGMINDKVSVEDVAGAAALTELAQAIRDAAAVPREPEQFADVDDAAAWLAEHHDDPAEGTGDGNAISSP